MELLEKLLPPLVVAIFMFVMNRNQKKRDDLLANEQAGIDKTKFNEYNAYCETCKKEVKLQMIG